MPVRRGFRILLSAALAWRSLVIACLGMAWLLAALPPAAAREVSVGIYPNSPKIMLSPDGSPSGILGELLAEIAAREGWQLRAVPCHWQGCLAATAAGEIDLLPDVAYTPDRAELLAFHRVPALHSWSQLYRRPGVNLSSMLDLEGRRVAVLGGSVQQAYLAGLLSNFGMSAALVPVGSLADAFALAARGAVDAAVANERYGERHAHEAGLVRTTIMFQPAQLFYGTGKGRNAELLEAIDRHLGPWQSNPASPLFEIQRRWGSPPAMVVPRWLWWALAGLVAFSALALAIAALLRVQVARRTRELKASEDRLATILNSVDAFIYMKDLEHRYTYVNQKVAELFGAPADSIVGRTDRDFFDDETVATLDATDRRVLEQGERVVIEETNRARAGRTGGTFLSVKIPLRDATGRIQALCGISTDISDEHRLADEIHQLSYYDPLTRLPNRRSFLERLDRSLDDGQGALVLVNLDNFKLVNDTLGHDTGDQLLDQAAQRLLRQARGDDFLARLGSDEFILLLDLLGLSDSEAVRAAELKARRVLEDLARPYTIGAHQVRSTASIGIALFRGSALAREELLKQADMALTRAKADGRDSLRFFDPAMQAEISARALVEAELRTALAAPDDNFVLHYQPQADEQGRWLGVEALVRWQHPTRGLLSPAHFIPIAEASNLILPLGRWILRAACRQLVAWQDDPATAALQIAVNISAREFRHPGFVDEVFGALQETGADPARLELELTESQLFDDIEQVAERMAGLRRRGVGFALDDFGTGYSSLSYLKRLPLDKLKIDQSFVRDLLTDPEDAAIVSMIVALGRTMNLKVIAEGVETEAQRDALLRLDCRLHQGYLLSPPVPAAALKEALAGAAS